MSAGQEIEFKANAARFYNQARDTPRTDALEFNRNSQRFYAGAGAGSQAPAMYQ
jgi:hypothetical protein